MANGRAAINGLPASLTLQQWTGAMEYWKHGCAVCGRSAGDNVSIAIDHWISLHDKRPNNPGTVAWNVIPLCHGKRHSMFCCNNTKHDRDPIEWLINVFGREKAQERLIAIEEYFNLCRSEKGLPVVISTLSQLTVKPKPFAVQLAMF